MCAIPLLCRFSLDFVYFPSILVLNRERRARKGITYMKKLITIILAIIMALFTAPNRSADQPHLTAVKTPQTAIVTQVEPANTEQSTNTPINATYEPTEPHPEPVPRKIRKSGTGCVYQINDHLWEGSFYPRLPNGKRKNSTSTPKPATNAKPSSLK